MTAVPIPTWYAGQRFRSRLEARWAVFFDRMQIDWEYEPQGYLIGHPADVSDRCPYLPDFWLPSQRLWVEVKGAATPADIDLAKRSATYRGGLPALGPYCDADDAPWPDNEPPDLVVAVLGPIPPDAELAHWWPTYISNPASTEPRVYHSTFTLWGELGSGGNLFEDPLVREAYADARNARFEHGIAGLCAA